MKKAFRIILTLTLLIAMPSLIFAGGSKETSQSSDNMASRELSHEELVEAARKEGSLTVYTHSSRTTKIADLFMTKYGIKVETTQLKDTEMIEKVSKEASANLDAADVVFCQDGSRVYPELVLTGYVRSYIPASISDQIIDEQYRNPFVWEIMNKVLIYNSENAGQPITNVWQLTEPEWKGRLQFKDPFSEGVNMNFFTMITRDDWAAKLADAYNALYGKDLVLTTNNAGYEWLKMLYANGVVLGKSDTTIAENVGAKGQSRQLMGLFTLNKLRTADSKNLALAASNNVVPFSGFMYPAYVFIPSNCRSLNAAKLFIEFSMTEEGWKPFDTIGDYSPVEALKNNSEDPLTLEDWSAQLVYEDPVWCAEARSDVEEFISSII
ncbi:MAG: ABC transporter substrate-binding protein [Sphaerochaeta sp.]